MARAFLSLGSNLPGDLDSPAEQLDRAINLLAAHPDITIREVSRYWNTPPWGGIDQDPFVNAALSLDTTLDPRALLDAAQDCERAGSRTRDLRWGPRTIDVDIIAYLDDADHPLTSPTPWGTDLELPHPRAHLRAFVLIPLRDLADATSADTLLLGAPLSRLIDSLDPADVAALTPLPRRIP